MTETKRCSGNKGEWACDYPDHMVPVEEFALHSERGLQDHCRLCTAVSNKMYMPHYNALIGKACTIAGISSKEIRAIPPVDRKALMDRARVALNSLPKIQKDPIVLDIQPKLRSEFGQSTPMTKRETSNVVGKKVPEGWVYVVRNPDVPSVIKIGKTFPNGIKDIMDDARRFGRSELVDQFWFEEAYRAEQSIHALLKHCNLRTLGHTDCGRELFKCTIEEAMDAITKVQSENDRPSVAVGG